MGGQRISMKRIFITNFLIFAVILIAGYISFDKGILDAVSKAVKAPAFTAHTANNGVALEIAVCEDADIEECMDVLVQQKVDASLFFCPAVMEKHSDLVEKAKALGFHTGLYDCQEHNDQAGIETSGDLMVLSDDAWDVSAYTARSRSQPCWTMDANKVLDNAGIQELSEKVYADCVLLYRAQKDIGRFEDMIRIIREKGYNITDVKSMFM